jgi:hypothetical protein
MTEIFRFQYRIQTKNYKIQTTEVLTAFGVNPVCFLK